MKLIIAGSRSIDSYELVLSVIKKLDLHIDEVVCGGARGVDTLGALYAQNHGIPIKNFPADWDAHGKKAGYLRNAEMADYADALLAFWDGESRGTKHMVDLARQKGIKVWIIDVDIETMIVTRIRASKNNR